MPRCLALGGATLLSYPPTKNMTEIPQLGGGDGPRENRSAQKQSEQLRLERVETLMQDLEERY